MVVEDLTARTAWAGITHRPEIVALVAPASRFVANPGQPTGINANLIQPDFSCVIIIFVDGDPQLFGWNRQRFGQKLPAVMDRLAFEVVAKAEVAQHLKKGVVAGSVTDILQIVVFAPGAHTAL